MCSDRPIEVSRVIGFCEAEISRHRDALVSPRSAAKDTEEECDSLADNDEDILTLNVDEDAVGDEMVCDVEGQTEQYAARVRTISDPGRRNKRERGKNLKRRTRQTEVGASRVCEVEESRWDNSDARQQMMNVCTRL